MQTISPRDAQQLVHGSGEFAFLDIREIVPFGAGHPFLAAHLPWSRFELEVTARVPRRTTPIVLCDQAGELCELAATRLAWLGYDDVRALDGGAAGWAEAGYALFPEIEVPAKGFGAFARIHGRPEYISPRELHAALNSGEDWIVLDSRPMAEYRKGNIPGSIDTPGPEVFRCFDDLVPDPTTKVVVNCMSATRGTLGGLSLMLGEVPNDVYVLHHGTRGWLLDGLELETAATRVPDPPSPRTVAAARRRAARIRRRAGIATVDAATLERWRGETDRTTYLFDVRSPAEFEAGHIAGARNAPEGRIVLSTEDFLATRNARVVLCDDDTARATITAVWLAQMGWGEVVVAEGAPDRFTLESGAAEDPATATLETLATFHDPQALSPEALRTRLESGGARVIDVGSSQAFCEGHLPGALWLSRGQVAAFLESAGADGDVVFTSGGGDAARLAATDRLASGATHGAVLAGGNAAWRDAGMPVEQGPGGLAGERVDAWLAASERPGDVTANVVAYLDWETRLMDEIEAAGETPYRDLVWQPHARAPG